VSHSAIQFAPEGNDRHSPHLVSLFPARLLKCLQQICAALLELRSVRLQAIGNSVEVIVTFSIRRVARPAFSPAFQAGEKCFVLFCGRVSDVRNWESIVAKATSMNSQFLPDLKGRAKLFVALRRRRSGKAKRHRQSMFRKQTPLQRRPRLWYDSATG